uniref:Uncharacterized protein n=1 Tax=Rhizophora mucronata TaxID=61149 RepID=A0A2P2QRH4_RHIMU
MGFPFSLWNVSFVMICSLSCYHSSLPLSEISGLYH